MSRLKALIMHIFLKRFFIIAVMTLTLGLVAGPALAASPHVVKGPTVTQDGNSLIVSASIAGLGNVPTADFTLSGDVTVFSQCYNKGGNNPAADNKEETIQVNQTETFPVRNGRTNVSFTITPLSTLTCPGNQVVRIESVTYDLILSGQGLSVPISSN
jgi:hypothetical protein